LERALKKESGGEGSSRRNKELDRRMTKLAHRPKVADAETLMKERDNNHKMMMSMVHEENNEGEESHNIEDNDE
jgi:hypothetical protein